MSHDTKQTLHSCVERIKEQMQFKNDPSQQTRAKEVVSQFQARVRKAIENPLTLKELYAEAIAPYIQSGGDGASLNEMLKTICLDAFEKKRPNPHRASSEMVLGQGTFLCQYVILQDVRDSLEYILSNELSQTLVQIQEQMAQARTELAPIVPILRVLFENKKNPQAPSLERLSTQQIDTLHHFLEQNDSFMPALDTKTYSLLQEIATNLQTLHNQGTESFQKISSPKAHIPWGIVDISEKNALLLQVEMLMKKNKSLREQIKNILPPLLTLVRDTKKQLLASKELFQ